MSSIFQFVCIEQTPQYADLFPQPYRWTYYQGPLLFLSHCSVLSFQSLEVSIVYEVFDDLDSPDLDYPKPSLGVVSQHQQSGSVGSYSSNASDSLRVGCSCVRYIKVPILLLRLLEIVSYRPSLFIQRFDFFLCISINLRLESFYDAIVKCVLQKSLPLMLL